MNMDWMTEPQIEELVNFQYADDEQALKELMEEEEFKFDSYLNSDIDYWPAGWPPDQSGHFSGTGAGFDVYWPCWEERRFTNQMTDTKFLIYGRDMRKQMNQCLAYLYPTAEEAVAACRKNHPDFIIKEVTIDDSEPEVVKVQSLCWY